MAVAQDSPPPAESLGVLAHGADPPTTPAPDTPTMSNEELERLGRQRPEILKSWLVEVSFVTTVVLSMMMSEYFISGFFICLPAVAVSLDMPDSVRTWPAAVINLTTACLLLPFSRLADRHGSKVIFLSGHAWLVAWSLVSGFSRNSTMLIVCRAMQGLGVGAFMPTGIALLARAYRPGPRKNLVFSLYGAFACIGFYVGIFFGALSAELLTWRWYFWLGCIMCALVFLLGAFSIPRGLGDTDPSVQMDWWGVCTIVPGLVLVVFAFTNGSHAPDGWRTPYIYVTLIIGALLLCAAVYCQGWVSKQPLLPAEIFRPKYMKRMLGGLFCLYGVFGLFLFYVSFYIEEALHIGPLLAAAWFTPLAVGGMFLAICGGFLLHILPNRILMIISELGFFLSVLLFALIPKRSSDGEPSISFLYWAYVFPAMICGTIGIDITFNVSNVFITTAMPQRLQSTAGGLINSVLYLGLAFWLGIGEMAVSTAVQYKGAENVDKDQQFRIGFWTGVALAALAFVLLITVRMGKASAALTADEKAELETVETIDRGQDGGEKATRGPVAQPV
ncbi:unnamed protein product [Clonostachys byssicola]|uniref:Major facilitator superfamily (MFS) profile domain-containing protein n=1 Tax=Clonostachys byssicola TaxID=160290 RepID=A0A9N9XVY2_9HYPO|nr:unnamed protein product [Clonostachys byssicola]